MPLLIAATGWPSRTIITPITEDAYQRHNKDRLQPFVLARQTVEQMTDQQHKIPGGKTGDDPTEESGAGGVRQQTADKTGNHAEGGQISTEAM